MVRSVVKCREFRGNKNCDNSDLLRKTRPKPVKNRKKPSFLIYSSRFLNGFERLSAEANFRMPAYTVKM